MSVWHLTAGVCETAGSEECDAKEELVKRQDPKEEGACDLEPIWGRERGNGRQEGVETQYAHNHHEPGVAGSWRRENRTDVRWHWKRKKKETNRWKGWAHNSYQEAERQRDEGGPR